MPGMNPTNDRSRWQHSFLAVAGAVGSILVFFGIAIFRYRSGMEVSVAVGAVTGTVGTILGGYLGIQAGAAGKSEAEQARREAEFARRAAEERATALAAALEPDKAVYVLNTVSRPNGLATMS
jgi:threonine/homoserine/homoserine lactone efflux protein